MISPKRGDTLSLFETQANIVSTSVRQDRHGVHHHGVLSPTPRARDYLIFVVGVMFTMTMAFISVDITGEVICHAQSKQSPTAAPRR